MSDRSLRPRARSAAVAAAAATLALSLTLASAAAAAAGPLEQLWRAQGEVGGDRGGRSAQTVLVDAMTLESIAGGYRGTVTYSDRVALQGARGEVLVQVSEMHLTLVGAPAAGGTALAGTFNGTARLDTFDVGSWEDAVAGLLPSSPSSSVTYQTLGHWGGRLTGSIASGELEFGSVTARSQTGGAVVRDATWFGRSDQSPQRFTASVKGAVSQPGSGGSGSGSTGSGGSGAGSAAGATTPDTVFGYILRGLYGVAKPAVAVPAESATAARALRRARPVGATPLPANTVTIDLDVAGHFLDAKNRACGTAPAMAAGARARAGWERARGSAPDAGANGSDTPGVLDRVLRAREDIPGARELNAAITVALASPAGDAHATSARIIEWGRAVRAVEGGPVGSVLAASADAARAVAASRVARGTARADALLAAADAFDAPAAARDVARFARTPARDLRASAAASSTGVLADALAAASPGAGGRPGFVYVSADGTRAVEPDVWQAATRADGALFWRAGAPGDTAATDGTLTGWAFSEARLYLTDAARVGRVYAIVPAPARKAK